MEVTVAIQLSARRARSPVEDARQKLDSCSTPGNGLVFPVRRLASDGMAQGEAEGLDGGGVSLEDFSKGESLASSLVHANTPPMIAN